MTVLRTLLSRLWRRRGFLVLTVAVLGLGLGAALTVLDMADALFWRPLPYANAERLVFAWQTDTRGTRLTVTGADFLSWSAGAEPFAEMGAVSARGFNLASDGEPERVEGALVSADLFHVLGARPLLGRVIDSGPAGPRVAVLSEFLWRRRFGADPAVVGRTLSLDGEPVQVVGVVPAAFRFPLTAQIWVSARTRVPEHPTYPIDPESDRARHFLTIVARLRPRWSVSTAGAVLSTLQGRLAREFPDDAGDVRSAVVTPFRQELFGAARPQCAAAVAQAASLSPPGAPLTATAPTSWSPTLIGIPPMALMVPGSSGGGTGAPAGRFGGGPEGRPNAMTLLAFICATSIVPIEAPSSRTNALRTFEWSTTRTVTLNPSARHLSIASCAIACATSMVSIFCVGSP